MTESARNQAEELLADIRHHLRTPLNHIIGYSDLLLEEPAGLERDGLELLEQIRSTAHVILDRVQLALAPGDHQQASEKIRALQQDVGGLIESIISNAGELAQKLHGPPLLDVLRVAVAGRELLTFLENGESRGRTRTSARSPEFSAAVIPSIPARLLVVDDDPTNCEVLRRQLERGGHRVTVIGSGVEALRLLRIENFDLVLLDVMMPGMSGFEVLQSLKSGDGSSSIPVIMMSALDELEVAAHCIQMGAEDYLLKPFDPVLLRARLHSALERKRLQQSTLERTAELESATQSLARANEDLNRFAYAASHDLQEPLRNITTTLQLLSRQFGRSLAPEQNELLSLAVDGARRMSELIQDLLAWSVANSRERTRELVDTESALADAVSNLRQSIEEADATISHDPLPRVLFDRGLLRQLFQNLIGNAIKYRREVAPRVHIGAQRAGNEWLFSVRDNGLGIESEFLQTIFEPFRRLHGRGLPGTGLGLAICARIVEGFGGRIWAESRPAIGSTFYFSVACQEENASTPVADAAAKAAR